LIAQKEALSSLLEFYSAPKQSSRKALDSGNVLIGEQKLQVCKEAKEIALRLSEEMNLDEIQSFEMYWNFQKSTTQNIVFEEGIIKSKVAAN
jgi:hypothetical protein